MQEMPSPILLVGDSYTCKNNVVSAKKKYAQYEWVELSAKEHDFDQIRAIAGTGDFFSTPKAVVITNILNRKAFREFLLELFKESSEKLKFIVLDSTGEIKIDPKTGKFNKTWGDWIKKVKAVKGSTVVNNGASFTEKNDHANVQFIVDSFAKYKRHISTKNASLFISIVGRDRGMALSEIQKMVFTCPKDVTEDFIRENAYHGSKEVILYKFSNALDEGYFAATKAMEEFLEAGMNENLLAEIVAKKVRWRMVAVHLWSTGLSWSEVERKLLQMGKFPSVIWHSDKATDAAKKKMAEEFSDIDKMQGFMVKKLGIPKDSFKKVDKKKAGESLPMPFLATQLVRFISSKLVRENGHIAESELKEKLVTKTVEDYLSVVEGLKSIRYGGHNKQDIYDMVKTASLTKVN